MLPPFSLIGHPGSASDLIRMAESVLTQSPELRLELENIDDYSRMPINRVCPQT